MHKPYRSVASIHGRGATAQASNNSPGNKPKIGKKNNTIVGRGYVAVNNLQSFQKQKLSAATAQNRIKSQQGKGKNLVLSSFLAKKESQRIDQKVGLCNFLRDLEMESLTIICRRNSEVAVAIRETEAKVSHGKGERRLPRKKKNKKNSKGK